MVPRGVGNYVGYLLNPDKGVLSLGNNVWSSNPQVGNSIAQLSSSSFKLSHDSALGMDFNSDPYRPFTICSEKGKHESGNVVTNVIQNGFSTGHVGTSGRHEEVIVNVKDRVDPTNFSKGQFNCPYSQDKEAWNAAPFISPKISSQPTLIAGEDKVDSVSMPYPSLSRSSEKNMDVYLTENMKYTKNNISQSPLMYHEVHQTDAPIAAAATTLTSSMSLLYGENRIVVPRKKRSVGKKMATAGCKKVMKEQNPEKPHVEYENMDSCTKEERPKNEPQYFANGNGRNGDPQIIHSSSLPSHPLICELNMESKSANGNKKFANSLSWAYNVEHPRIHTYDEKISWSDEKTNACHENGMMSSKYSELDLCQVNITQIDPQINGNANENFSSKLSVFPEMSEGNLLMNSELSMEMRMDEGCLECREFALTKSLLLQEETSSTCKYEMSSVDKNRISASKNELLIGEMVNSSYYEVTDIAQIHQDVQQSEELLGDVCDSISEEQIARKLAMSLGPQADFVEFLKYVDSVAMFKRRDRPGTEHVNVGLVNSGYHTSDKTSVKQKPESQVQDKENDDCRTSKGGVLDALISDETIRLSNKNKRRITNKRKRMGGGNPSAKERKNTGKRCSIVRRMVKEVRQENSCHEKAMNILSTLIKEGMIHENEVVCYEVRNSWDYKGLRGFVTREGIHCTCCRNVVSLKEFGAHAGSYSVKHLYNIFVLRSRMSLLNCLSEVWRKEKKDKNIQYQLVCTEDVDPSDDTCGVCADGGQLVCCDSCPSTFHQECVMLKVLPEGKWYCPFCRCAFCSAYEHLKLEGCILHECRQCGQKYHRECTWEWNKPISDLDSKPFCGDSCMKIASKLSHMVGATNPVGDGFTWTLLKRVEEDENINSDESLSFFMECNVKLSLALSVLNECFVPLIDVRTADTCPTNLSTKLSNCDVTCVDRENELTRPIFSLSNSNPLRDSSNYKRLNYEHFCTVILEKNEDIISVALLRIHGAKLAEMPFIATRDLYRQQGMCRLLLSSIEQMLSSLSVEKLIISAIPDLVETWKKSFSFGPLEESHKEEIRNVSIMGFAGTTLLQKPIFQHSS